MARTEWPAEAVMRGQILDMSPKRNQVVCGISPCDIPIFNFLKTSSKLLYKIISSSFFLSSVLNLIPF